MKLPTVPFTFTLLTPCFAGTWQGKDPKAVAELRVPPLRGHLRDWHRILFGYADTERVWGSTAGNTGNGSRVAVRLSLSPEPSSQLDRLLPHADPNSSDYQERRKAGGRRAALPADTRASFELQRLPNCTAENWEHAQHATKAWLLLGCLGYRSNRAAGSVWPIGDWAPATLAEFVQAVRRLGCNWALALTPESVGSDAISLRKAASDTANGAPMYLGQAVPKRIPSPTRFKVIRLGKSLRLLIVAPDSTILDGARRALCQKHIPAKSKPAEWQTLR